MQPLAVIGIGSFCPVGLDAEHASASLWAGVPRKQQCSIVDRRFEPIVMGYLPQDVLPPLVDPLQALRPGLTALQRRLLRLATPALHEVLGAEVDLEATAGEDEPRFSAAALPPGLDPLPPLLIAGPAPVPERPPIMTGRFIGQAALQSGVPIDASNSRVFPTGHAGFFAALEHARTRIIEPGDAELVVVGGVDSYLDPYRLAVLEREERLLTEGAQDGFTPGEAAAFVSIASRVACRRHGWKPLVWIDGIGLGQEPGHRYSDQPYRGDGLAAAIREALAGDAAPPEPIRLVMAGFNGEAMHTKEWGVAHVRNRKHFAEGFRIEHSAEYTGDLGAALAPMMLAATALALRDGEVQGPALIWGASDQGQRGALRLRAA
ncbi:MAG: hypothetical protein K0V04_39110 [Deltaproteobacteria bacterium]|nr:hypothetical protein [Deltaproteobacteria bacterium]